MQSTVYSLQSEARVYERTGNGKRSSAQNGTVRSTAIRRHRSGDQRWNAHNTQIGKNAVTSRFPNRSISLSIFYICVCIYSRNEQSQCCRRYRNHISMNGTSDSIRPYISRRMAVNVCHLNSNWSIVKYDNMIPHPVSISCFLSLYFSLSVSKVPWSYLIQCFSSVSACQSSYSSNLSELFSECLLPTISITQLSPIPSLSLNEYRRFRDTLQVSQRWFLPFSYNINYIYLISYSV